MTAGRTIAPHYSGGATVTGMLTMAELRPGDVVADRFRIVRLLGMGGMGVVYHAHDTELDVDVALKLLRPELASRHDAFERFRQELLLARQVSSPHVVRIHDLVRHGEVWLISMDFVPGHSLERLLDTKGHLPPEDAIRIVRQLALGLVAAAYMAETIRAGIQAVPKGQMEAARSLGFSPARAMISIIVPQAFRIILPPLTNELVLLFKDSSLVLFLGDNAAEFNHGDHAEFIATIGLQVNF